MKLCLVAHGYPPELEGGTEKAVRDLAQGLVRRGHDVVVVAGSMDHAAGFRTSAAEDPVLAADGSPAGVVRVRRVHRADLFFDHWQKSGSARVSEAVSAIFAEERPDLVHVHHWIRMSRDLVATAARLGIPAAVTLHDFWTSCLITFRVRPDTKEFCEVPLAPDPCLACAGLLPPRTPWMKGEALHMAFAERRADLVRELTLARAVFVPSRAHAEALTRYLSLRADELNFQAVPSGRTLAFAPAQRPAPPRESGRLVLGSWGHLHPLKGPDLVLDALERLGDPATWELVLAGGEVDAGFAQELRARAQGKNVTIHGPFTENELDGHPVTEVHAMVSGTRARESWGLVVDEAAALRLPMVLPRSGAFPERLAEGQGVLFYEPRDAGSLAEVLRRLRDEATLLDELAAALPPTAALVPDPEEAVARVLGVYDEVLALGPPAAPATDWWNAKMKLAAEAEWDASLARRTAAELGFEEPR